ncbi:hypothetical protein OS493_003938 [Desmophyllum pertusum]|uniref:Uncharacterized protein n=1 Tax=Desmophyllum pertusum TaxID=174260 RepID=A0A9W9ZSF1_9CNID|nr:hypothetical protein OS493_003938 [Desmophyllum pertusum]
MAWKKCIQASTTVQDQELRLSGLAVFSKLANACQPLVDVSKSNVQVNKIALISLAKETACSLQELALNAQNAGYSVVIYCGNDYRGTHAQTEDKLLIPVAYMGGNCQSTDAPDANISQLLLANDQTNVEIRVQVPRQRSNDLRNMEFYLERLYFWFLLGPIITLEWLRRTKKLCGMSGGQHVDHRLVDDEERATGDEETTVVTVSETDLHSIAEETPRNDDQETEELQPLITVMNDSRTNPRHIVIYRRVTTFFGNVLKICMSQVAVGFVYAIALIAALPVGISSGGLSFFVDSMKLIQLPKGVSGMILLIQK